MRKRRCILAACLLLNLCSCGRLDGDKISGTWTLTRVNGVETVQFAAVMGLEISEAAVNYTFFEDSAVMENIDGESDSLLVQWQKGGVLVNSRDFFFYDEERETLTIEYEEYTCIFTRGEFCFGSE
ncbi:MAG: hypothetical protein IJ416_11340 [Ruminiclostridium sp.]|nr:hypothetical protein [Ruminiclostridium sp.]MBQ8825882.1 hypothetical protein [Oscillospiraceae bacterium]